MPHVAVVYDWEELEQELSKLLDIKPDQFRKYPTDTHPGDIWQVYDAATHEEIFNGTYSEVWLHTTAASIQSDYILRVFPWLTHQSEVGEAFQKLASMIDPDNEGIIVHYNW